MPTRQSCMGGHEDKSAALRGRPPCTLLTHGCLSALQRPRCLNCSTNKCWSNSGGPLENGRASAPVSTLCLPRNSPPLPHHGPCHMATAVLDFESINAGWRACRGSCCTIACRSAPVRRLLAGSSSHGEALPTVEKAWARSVRHFNGGRVSSRIGPGRRAIRHACSTCGFGSAPVRRPLAFSATRSALRWPRNILAARGLCCNCTRRRLVWRQIAPGRPGCRRSRRACASGSASARLLPALPSTRADMRGNAGSGQRRWPNHTSPVSHGRCPTAEVSSLRGSQVVVFVSGVNESSAVDQAQWERSVCSPVVGGVCRRRAAGSSLIRVGRPSAH